MMTTWATTMKITVIGDNAICNKGNNEDIHDNNLLGKKNNSKTSFTYTLQEKQNNHANDHLLKKQEESQLLFVAKNKRSSNFDSFLFQKTKGT